MIRDLDLAIRFNSDSDLPSSWAAHQEYKRHANQKIAGLRRCRRVIAVKDHDPRLAEISIL